MVITAQMKKMEKVFHMAKTASFNVDISEKGQAMLAGTVVSYKT
jgi:hypothetical protein